MVVLLIEKEQATKDDDEPYHGAPLSWLGYGRLATTTKAYVVLAYS